MTVAARKQSFTQLMRATAAISERGRDRRLSAAKLAGLGPKPPLAAQARMKLATTRLAEIAERALREELLAQLPAGGGLAAADYGTVQRAIERIERRLQDAVSQLGPTVRAALRGAAKHGHDEFERIMDVRVPTRGVPSGVATMERTVEGDMRRYVGELVSELRGALAEVAGKAPDRPVAEVFAEKLWVPRVRGDQLARSRPNQLFQTVFEMWAGRAGDDLMVWVTRRDDRVREKHRALHGVVFSLQTGVNGLFPGQAVNCRCTSIPKSLYDRSK